MHTAPVWVCIATWLLSNVVLAAPCDGFVDVDSSDTTYCAAVSYVKDRGVTVGCTDDTHYCPNDYVTRLQMALFLQRMGRADPSNTLGDNTTAVGGGTDNTAKSPAGNDTVAGGFSNSATGGNSTVSGGNDNAASGSYSAVLGGFNNSAAEAQSAVLGGESNVASGFASVVIGGQINIASASNSVAAGYFANASYAGCMVFADASHSNPTSCGADNEFVARAEGGFFVLTAGADDAHYTGTYVAPGSSSWTTYSDRNGKTNIVAVDSIDVLDKLSAIPVATWNWKAQDASIHHMGPMAQDFYAAFGLGETDKGISVVDAQGVALAAIQGLNAKVEARDAVISAQARELADVKATLASMQRMLGEMTQGQQQVAVTGR